MNHRRVVVRHVRRRVFLLEGSTISPRVLRRLFHFFFAVHTRVLASTEVRLRRYPYFTIVMGNLFW